MAQWNWQIVVLAAVIPVCSASVVSADEPIARQFSEQIAPVFAARCLACHGTQKQEGGYSLAKLEQLFRPGDSGEKPIVAGEPEASELFRRLTSSDPDERMPSEGDPLSQPEIAAVRSWIAGGASLPSPASGSLAEYASKSTGQMAAPKRYPKRLPISAVAASSNGSRIYASGYAEITVWDSATGQLVQRIPTGWPYVADIEIAPDGQWLATSVGVPGQIGVTELIHIFDAEPTATIASSSDVFPDLVYSPDGKQLCIGGADGSLRIVNVESRKTTHQSTPHADRTNAVAWSADGKHLLTASHDRTAKIFRADTFDLLASFDRHDRTVGGVAFLNGTPITCDESGKLQIWTSDGADKSIAEKSGLARFAQRFCATGKELLIPQKNLVRRFTIQTREIESGKDEDGKPKKKTVTEITELPALSSTPSTWIMSICSLPDGRVFAGSDRGEILVWQAGCVEPCVRFIANPL